MSTATAELTTEPAPRVADPPATTPRSTWTIWLPALAPWLLSLGMTIAAYGSSLHGGIMFDAALDLPRATERGWLALVSNAGDWPYYRPVVLLLAKAAYVIRGGNDFVLLHAISLASHIVCCWLVYQLARRLMGWPAGVMAAALFAWFPLDYQLVAFADPPSHALMGLFLLAAVVLYLDGHLMPALVSGGMALLTHENSVAMLFPAMVGVDLLRRRARWRRSAWFALETVAFLLLWWVVPRWPSSFHLDVPSIRLNAAYFLQALAYPVSMQLGRLPRAGNDVLEVVVVTAAVVLGLMGIALARRRLGIALFGLLWFAASVLASCLLLPWPNYVIDAPRLLYVGSMGIALLWAAALAPSPAGVLGSWRRLRGWNLASLAATVGVLASSFAFIGVRERLLDQGADVVTQVLSTATTPIPEAGRVYVNVPAFLGPTSTDFLLGHSGITMLPDYFGLDLDVAAGTGQHLPVTSLAYDELARSWDAAYGPQGHRASLAEVQQAIRGGGGVYVARFDPGRIDLEYAGQLESASPDTPPLATFGGFASLQSAQVAIQGAQLVGRLVWKAAAPAPGDYTVFVHVVGPGGQLIAQDDGYPIETLMPPKDWRAGDGIVDERRIPLPASVSGQPLRVLVGLYDRASPTTRAAATDPSGQRFTDDSVTAADITAP